MKPTITKATLAALAIVGCCAFCRPAEAQDRGTIVICPAVFDNNSGTDEARAQAIRTIEDHLQNAGFAVLSYRQGQRKWNAMEMPLLSADAPATLHNSVRFGEAMHARFVLAPTFDIHSRTMLEGPERQIQTNATVGVTIVSVPDRQTVYSRTGTYAQTTEKAADESVNSRTMREEHAIGIAVKQVLDGWTNQDQQDQ